MKREKKSGSAFPFAIFALVMGCIQTALTVLVASVTPASLTYILAMVGMCLVAFGGAVYFYWQHKIDEKYDVLIEEEDREREHQFQEQASNQHQLTHG